MNLLNKKPVPRIEPLPPDPEFADFFARFAAACGGFIPNAMLIMQLRPKVLLAFTQMAGAVSDPETSEVDEGFKRLIALVTSHAAGCRYCMAHNAVIAHGAGIEDAKLNAVWEYRASPLFTEAERVALAAGRVPNEVTDEMFAKLHEYWSDGQIVEIVAMISLFGFLNRWNDTFATPIEDGALAGGLKYLASHGWEADKHLRSL